MHHRTATRWYDVPDIRKQEKSFLGEYWQRSPLDATLDKKEEEVCLPWLKSHLASTEIHNGTLRWLMCQDRGWFPGLFLMDCNNYFKAGAVSMWLLRQQQYPLPPLISYKITRIRVLCRVSGQFLNRCMSPCAHRFLGVILCPSDPHPTGSTPPSPPCPLSFLPFFPHNFPRRM